MADEREPAGCPDPPTADDEVLVALLVRGAIGADRVGDEFPSQTGAEEGAAERCVRAGDVAARSGDRLALTPTGRARAEALLAGERTALANDAAAIEPAFGRLNRTVKQAITDFQVRRVGSGDTANDHGDPRYDAEVVDELCRAVDAAAALLEPLAQRRVRFAGYRDRLARAALLARAGERAFVSGLTVDSIHTVWWQLHAELLAILGRARRADEH